MEYDEDPRVVGYTDGLPNFDEEARDWADSETRAAMTGGWEARETLADFAQRMFEAGRAIPDQHVAEVVAASVRLREEIERAPEANTTAGWVRAEREWREAVDSYREAIEGFRRE